MLRVRGMYIWATHAMIISIVLRDALTIRSVRGERLPSEEVGYT